MKIYLHTKGHDDTEWTGQELDFARIPHQSEYMVLSPDSEYYQVKLVVHTPYEKGAFDAEVWAVETSQAEVMKARLGEVVDE